MPTYKYTTYAVYCDYPKCDNLEEDGYSWKSEAVKAWRRMGWRKTDKGWICPRHPRRRTRRKGATK